MDYDTKTIRREELPETLSRDKIIVRTSVTGILANIFLAAFKAVIGILSNSIAVTLDAVNSLTDAASSVITIVGTKLAGRAPDRKHPFGHGRSEYLSALVISVIVLYAGITSLKESVAKIIHPAKPEYSGVALLIIAGAVVVKILPGPHVQRTGKKVNSDSLVNSGKDALLDSVISAATLAAAFIFMLTGLSLEAWLGAVISVLIIKSGIEMLRETLSRILGERADASLVREIKDTVRSFPEVYGAYDLVLHNYGPETYNGSIHIEVADTMTAAEIDDLLRRIMVKVYRQCHVILTAIGVYSVNTKDEETIRIREDVRDTVTSYRHVLQMHGFYLDKEEKRIRFDLVVGFEAGNRAALFEKAVAGVRDKYPDYRIEAAMDADYTESE